MLDNYDRGLEESAERLVRWINHHRTAILLFFSVAYFGVTLSLAQARPLWFDELFTYYISLLPLERILEVLRTGQDHHPPPFYILSRWLFTTLADPHVGLRLAQIVGIWAASVSVCIVVARRTTAVYGLLALFVLLGTLASHYGIEARPSGLATGFAGVALLSWQLAADQKRRALTLPILALALFGGVSSHYYAVLVFLGIAVGEGTRAIIRRRIDWGVIAAMACAAALSGIYLPFVVDSVGGFEARNWAAPHLRGVYNEYLSLFGNLAPSLFLLFGLLALGSTLVRPRPLPDSARGTPTALAADVAAAITLLALPILQYVVAVTLTNKMHERYVLQATIGFAVLAGLAVHAGSRRHPSIGLVVTAVLALQWIGFTGTRIGRDVQLVTPVLQRLAAEQLPELPIVVDDQQALLTIAHSSSPEFRSRLVYLVDSDAARRHARIPPPRGGEIWLLIQHYMPVQAVPREAFLSRHREFLLYSRERMTEFQIGQTLEDGAEILLVAYEPSHWLYRVRYPEGSLRGSDSPTSSSTR